jgi:serine/threonine protein kinase/tetratricopeptide (TPR) repeat protein
MLYDPLIEVGTVFQERYRILEKLSNGGFGVVYKAEQLATGQTVAIKGIRRFGPTPADDEKRLARFQREVRLCAQLHHPNIVRLIDSGWIDQSMYAVFEYVPGHNLAEVLAEEGRLAPVECGRLMGQVLDALSCAHDVGIIHRDLKPANIMVTPTGARRNATVLDFGIGGVLREAQGLDEKTLTTTFERMGTPAYSSPEQLRGRVLTPQTDIYSWGLVFLECLTGNRAIDGETIAEVMHRQLDETPVPIPRALKGHPLDELLRTATAKNATYRRYSARELLARLDACPLAALDLSSEDAVAAQTPEEYSTLGLAQRGAGGPAGRPSMNRVGGAPGGSPDSSAISSSGSSAISSAISSSGSSAISSSGSRPNTGITGEGLVADRERRQLTVVSCAVDVMAGDATPLDIEEHEERLAAEVTLCRVLAAPLGGYVMPGTENRVLIYFGYPTASGDDARRAVRAALVLAREFETRGADTQRGRGIRSSVRIGVHTGLVLVRDDAQGQGPVTFSGGAVRLASNIDAHARPNGVVISKATLELVRAHFTAAPGVRVPVAGQAEPMEIFQVAEVGWDEPMTTLASDEPAAPLIGREQDLDLLRRHWRLACEGRGQSVLIVGDPGIGKSRLVRELAHVLHDSNAAGSRRAATHGGAGAAEGLIWLQSRCMPENRHNALRPAIELLQRHLGFRPGSDDDERRRKLEELLAGFDVDRATAMPLLASLLGVPLGDAYTPLALAPQRQRELTLRILLALLSDMAMASPVVLVLEDVHWADASTIELLGLLLEEAQAVSMLIVLTSRPEGAGALEPTATLKLDRLDSEAAAALVQRCAGDRALPPEVVGEILRRTDGVPLFVEEMVRAVLGSAMLVEQDGRYKLQGPLSGLEIPASLRELLLARLDRLSREAKAALQIGAVLGREFGSEELRTVGGYSEEALRRLIDALVESGLLYCRRRLSGELFVFKHALVHDAAYESMPRRTRAMYHRHIARMIEERFPAVAEKQPELLARHHAGAGDVLTALGYARRAALSALIASANEEAIGHARQAIAWLQDLDQSQWSENQRAELELGFQAIIAPALLGTRGHGDREFGALARRSLRLISMVGESPQVLPALWGLWIHHYMRSEYSRALPLAENYLERAERLGDLGARVIGHSLVGSTLFYLGRFADAHAAAARSVELYDPEAHGHLMMIVGYDTKPPQLGLCALCAWMLGRPDEAAANVEDALAWSATLKHAVTQGLALFFQAHLRLWNGELALAESAAGELLALAERYGLDNWLLLAEVMLGAAQRDVARMRAAMGRLEQANQVIGFSCWHALLADSEAAAGRPEQALIAIEEALSFAERTGEHHFLPEIHRRLGEILAMQPDPARRAQAEPRLRRAIEVARERGAPMSELLSTASLCKLQAQEQRVDPAALDALRGMFAKLTEGASVPVIASARAVLAELGG